MTRIEKAVTTVSDLHDFYRRIPKIGGVAKGDTPAERDREGVTADGRGPKASLPDTARQ